MSEDNSSEFLAAGLAADVAAALTARLQRSGGAALAVPGGATPVKFLRALSRQKLDWPRITITLTDERRVPEDSPRRNARLVRENLLHGEAASARFIPLDPANEAEIAALAPYAAIVLGMGLDGHTASLFPHGDRLAQALAGPRAVETITAPAAEEPRFTLTLPILLGADFLALLIEGNAKFVALNAAMHPGEIADMPVRGVLARAPRIYWCP